MSTGGWARSLLRGAAGLGAATAIALTVTACGGSSGGPGAPVTGETAPMTALPGDGGGAATPTAPSSSLAGSPGGNQQTGQPSPTATPTLDASETEGECPYLSAAEAADLEGNRVGRTTVLATSPPGCRFYFAYDLSQPVLGISTQLYADEIDANNAMVTAAMAGKNAAAATGIADGAVLFQTTFSEQHGDEWACAFVKGNLLVIVRTNQTDVSFNARRVAETIAPRL